jgi:4'-phosphopantetheinyl transferase
MAPLVHIVDPSLFPPSMGEKILTAEEKARAARFHFPADRDRWSACRTALRMILSARLGLSPREIPLLTEAHGKPALPEDLPLAFNLSHCHDLALVVTCNRAPLGIDIEPLARASSLEGCENTFCHPAELAALPAEDGPRNLALLELWTAKEAFLKALGTGLSHPPEEVLVSIAEGTATSPGLPDLQQLRLHRLHHRLLGSHLAALACPSDLSPPRLVAFP